MGLSAGFCLYKSSHLGYDKGKCVKGKKDMTPVQLITGIVALTRKEKQEESHE